LCERKPVKETRQSSQLQASNSPILSIVIIIMKLSLVLLLSISAIASATDSTATVEEDTGFWDRFLQSDSSLPPVPTPGPPTPAPPPTGQCTIGINASCVVAGNSNSAGLSCDSPTVGVEPCLQRPEAAYFLFNGGDCSQSDNTQPLKFFCTDENGGPPTNIGDEAYIVVNDAKGKSITYFSGIVKVGDFFPANDGGRTFEADQTIQILSPDQSTVLQNVQYHSSCSSNLELKNRFGASQLVGFYNQLQGNVTCFNTFEFSLMIDVPITIQGDGITLTSLRAETNFAGTIDLTDKVTGENVTPGGSVAVTLSGEVDTSSRRAYTLDFFIEGTQSPSGLTCTGTDSISFDAGNPGGVNSNVRKRN
jgi:hypothetical protein